MRDDAAVSTLHHHRPLLHALAYRMLGSATEAEAPLERACPPLRIQARSIRQLTEYAADAFGRVDRGRNGQTRCRGMARTNRATSRRSVAELSRAIQECIEFLMYYQYFVNYSFDLL